MVDEGPRDDEGGESACFAHVICPECGAVLDGSGHSKQCTFETLAMKVNRPDRDA